MTANGPCHKCRASTGFYDGDRKVWECAKCAMQFMPEKQEIRSELPRTMNRKQRRKAASLARRNK